MHMGEMGQLNNFLDTSKFDVFTFGKSPIQIDILSACKGVKFAETYRSAVMTEVADGFCVSVVDYKSLIIAKKASNRFRDQADIEELEKVKKKGNKSDI